MHYQSNWTSQMRLLRTSAPLRRDSLPHHSAVILENAKDLDVTDVGLVVSQTDELSSMRLYLIQRPSK